MSLTQKILWTGVPLAFSTLVLLYGPVFQGLVGTAIFIGVGTLVGLVTWFVSAAWTFRLELTASDLVLVQSGRRVVVPLDRIGILLRNGGFPFPTLWLILRGADVGQDLPEKSMEAGAAALIEAYRRRNPGKKLTVVPIPGGHLGSIPDFAGELKRRIPPVTVDDRLTPK